MKNIRIVYLGFNKFTHHKRGVENVIDFQRLASPSIINYYFFWDSTTNVTHYGSLICIGIKKNILWFIYLNLILFKLKFRNKYLFIHSHNALMSIMSIFKSNIFTVHDGLYYYNCGIQHRLKYIFWFLEKLLYTRCNLIHFISEYAKKMSLYNASNNYSIISNTSHFESSKNLETKLNTKFNENAFKIFTVRSIEDRALINLLINIAAKLKDENFHFLIAGKGPMLSYYQSEIKSLNLDNICLLGYISDIEVINHYKKCDVVLMPASYGEGFGLPIIEGYLFNKPVIASNVCAIPEVIFSDDFLFNNNINDIISKLLFVKKIKKYDYYKYYCQNFSNDIIISKMVNLYQRLM